MSTLSSTRDWRRMRTSTTGRRPGPWRQRWWIYLLLILGLLLLVGPFIWMVLGSIKTTGELRQVPPTWLPQNPTLANYEDLFSRLSFPRFFLNSTIVAAGRDRRATSSSARCWATRWPSSSSPASGSCSSWSSAR